MTQLCLTLLGLSVGVQSISNPSARESRSLVNTFPFNSDSGLEELPSRDSRQGGGEAVSIPFKEVAKSYAGGKRCIDKVFMESVTEWDTVIQCDHSYNRRCAKSLKTTYTAQQEEECQENYVKKCFIEYEKTAQNVTVSVCRTPLVKDCSVEGEEVCSTQYESECVTEQEVHQVTDDVPECQTVVEEKCEDDTSGYTTSTKCSKWPKEVCTLSKQDTTKYTPLTKCTKVPVELCGPSGCGFVEGEEQCYERTQTIVGDKPEETCSLDPQTTCKHVTKLVPRLEEVENCFDVPKEVCVRSETNPRKVQKPVIKKWCYVTTCPDECVEAARRGECLPECEEFRGQDRCCAPCPSSCLAAAASQQCPAECKRFSDNPKCCFECPAECKAAYNSGESKSSCRKYSKIPECFIEPPPPEPECPTFCQTAFSRGQSESSCQRYQYEFDNCYVPPPKPSCPAECLNSVRLRENNPSCQKYQNSFDVPCYVEPCPTKCEDAYKNGLEEASCKQYSRERNCYLSCPKECSQAYGNKVQEKSCEKYKNERNCYYVPPSVRTTPSPMPKCPAKCTNKRRSECGLGGTVGVPECDNIPGCCPEHFGEVFGAGVYLPPPKNS